jgi:hypothetical protein
LKLLNIFCKEGSNMTKKLNDFEECFAFHAENGGSNPLGDAKLINKHIYLKRLSGSKSQKAFPEGFFILRREDLKHKRLKCDHCGRVFLKEIYEIKRSQKNGDKKTFCSHKCCGAFYAGLPGYYQRLKDTGFVGRSGPDHPNWRGGIPPGEHFKRAKKKWPEKHRARQIFYRAVKTGTITRPETCPLCGRIAKICAHHKDYDKPLEVEWKCHRCHAKDRIGVKLERSPIPQAA